MSPIVDQVSAREAIARTQAALAAAGRTARRSPPAEPTTCCGRGCNGCVWEAYFCAVEYWCSQCDAPDPETGVTPP